MRIVKEELTREEVAALANCNVVDSQDCETCQAIKICDNTSKAIRKWLAEQLLDEMDKPKVWDGAPDDAKTAQVMWFDKNDGFASIRTFTREPPKTRARIMAEEISAELNGAPRYKNEVDIIESALNKYAEELTNTKETE